MKLIVKSYLVLLLAILVCTPSTSQAQSAAAIQQKLAATYENMTAMTAEFVQITTSAFLESSERFSGSIQLSRDKYRVQTGSQTIVTDGITLWIHNRAEKQVIINSYESDASSFSLTTFLGQIGKTYRLTLDGSTTKDGIVFDLVKLLPSDNSNQFRSVQMRVRRSDSIVTRLEVIDLNDVQMTFDLSSVKVNPSLPMSTFVLTIPEGVEVIDLRN